MQREIKFRGQRADTKEWIYGYLIKNKLGWAFIITDENINKFIRIIPETVGQYTGLKDKNGKEIYEGNIVRYAPGDEEFHPEGVIKWDRAEFRVFWKRDSLMSNDNLRKDLFFWANEREIEVIGNIYDNPELLQEVAK